MTAAQRVLIITALGLIGLTMSYGVWYALFDEHQTLTDMGMSMAMGFVEAARQDLPAAMSSLDTYAAVSTEYRNEVHAHGHWGMLALVLLVLGLVYEQLQLSETGGLRLAWLLAISSTCFPLGILIQNSALQTLGQWLASAGSLGMLLGLAIVVLALIRARR
ncbi:MAG: hypothetical protein HOC23_16785 [Halieaceae bacterium]|jgi:hypothetical protein|nr:hypothetical protein [Halieaceae bacterium]